MKIKVQTYYTKFAENYFSDNANNFGCNNNGIELPAEIRNLPNLRQVYADVLQQGRNHDKSYYFNANHLGSGSLITDENGATYQTLAYAPWGESLVNITHSGSGSYDERFKFSGFEKDTESGLHNYGARLFSEDLGPISPDAYTLSRPSKSPYLNCSNNPVMRIDPDGNTDYYDEVTGKYLGTDAIDNGELMMMSSQTYNDIQAGTGLEANKITELYKTGRPITIDDATINQQLQDVKNSTQMEGVEHQSYIVLDRENATITAIRGEKGGDGNSTITTSTLNGAPTLVKGGDGKKKILIAQVHGHNATNKIGRTTSKTMSSDVDLPTSHELQIPIYGIDAMDNTTTSNPANIHRVTPDGTITNNVGNTLNFGNILGREALKIWGTSGFSK
jgi:RHS repeat-associated protein